MDSCTECWVLLIMSSTANDVLGAALYFSVCVWGGGVCVCMQVLVFTFHSRCMGNSICHGSTPLTSCILLTHTYLYCSTLTHCVPLTLHSQSEARLMDSILFFSDQTCVRSSISAGQHVEDHPVPVGLPVWVVSLSHITWSIGAGPCVAELCSRGHSPHPTD